MKRFTINEFIEDYKTNSDRFFGFYDWFCNDESLERKAKAMIPKLKFLVKEGIINGDTCYVWFKNSCPVSGSLYDDLRISTLEEDYLGGLCPRTGHNVEDKCQVWTLKGDYKDYEFKDYRAFKKEVKTNPKFKETLIEAFKN